MILILMILILILILMILIIVCRRSPPKKGWAVNLVLKITNN